MQPEFRRRRCGSLPQSFAGSGNRRHVMATAAEQTFIRAVAAAEGTRQTSKASAFATYGFVLANLSAYVAALSAADVAYFTAVTAALNTAGLTGNTGQSGPLGGNWASIAT